MDSLRPNEKSRCGPDAAPSRRPGPRSPARRASLLGVVTAGSLLTLSALLGLGCGDEDVTPTLSFRVVAPPPPAATGECPAAVSGDELSALVFDAVGTPDRVRITYLASDTKELLCDAVLDFAGDNQSIVAVPDSGSVDMVVEFFNAENARVATARATGVNLSGDPDGEPGGEDGEAEVASDGTISVIGRLAGFFGCANLRLQTARAFHSTTVLPDGSVLILGGAVANSGGAEAIDRGVGLFVTDSVEHFDPATGVLTPLVVPGLLPRALHQTYVVTSSADGSGTIAVVGGVTTQDPSTPALKFDDNDMHLSIALGIGGAPIQMLTYEPRSGGPSLTLAQTITDSQSNPLASHTDPASVSASTQLLSAGGVTRVDDGMGGEVFAVQSNAIAYEPFNRMANPNVALAAARVGATVSDLGNGQALIWGGNVPTGSDPLSGGELVSQLAPGQTPISGPATLDAVLNNFTPRAFHTAIALGSQDVLVVGGFDISGLRADEPVAQFVERITVTGTTVAIQPITSPIGTEVGGFASAIALPGGGALITGGSPATCLQDGTGIECASLDGIFYDAVDSTLARTAGRLQVARYGHQATALGDGRVLITGGIHAGTGSAFRASNDIELVDLGTPESDAVPALMRQAGEVATDGDGDATNACKIIGKSEPAQ